MTFQVVTFLQIDVVGMGEGRRKLEGQDKARHVIVGIQVRTFFDRQMTEQRPEIKGQNVRDKNIKELLIVKLVVGM